MPDLRSGRYAETCLVSSGNPLMSYSYSGTILSSPNSLRGQSGLYTTNAGYRIQTSAKPIREHHVGEMSTPRLPHDAAGEQADRLERLHAAGEGAATTRMRSNQEQRSLVNRAWFSGFRWNQLEVSNPVEPMLDGILSSALLSLINSLPIRTPSGTPRWRQDDRIRAGIRGVMCA